MVPITRPRTESASTEARPQLQTQYWYADEVDEDETTAGPHGPLGELNLPQSSEDDDITFDQFMTRAEAEHASDDKMTSDPANLVTYAEKEALLKDSEKELPAELLQGKHHEVESRESDSFDPYESESSDLQMDVSFDPESIHPVDMGNPEVSSKQT